MRKKFRAAIPFSVIATLILALFFVLSFPPLLWAQGSPGSGCGSLAIGTYQLVSYTRISATVWAYTYKASITNNGTTTAPGVLATVTSLVSTTVVTNGTIHFGDVPAGATQTSTDTFTLQIDRRYPLTNSSLSWTIDCTDATATTVIGIAGGTISVQNHLGDTLTLEIPPLALDEDTSISVSVLYAPLPNPIADNIYPGAVLEPSGLIFSKPYKMTVNFHQPLTDLELATLYYLKDSDLVLPIANQNVTQNSIGGEYNHFSPIIGGIPSQEEIWREINQIEALGGDATALGIVNAIDDYLALMGFAQQQELTGYPDWADQTRNAARGQLEEYSLNLLSTPEPSNPCGQYSVAIDELKSLISSALGDNSLANQVGAKACTLNVSPNSLSLYTGESGQVLTATLLDPNGNQRSCAVLNWYSANLNVVGIGPIHNPTSGIIGVGPGAANVSANCDGLLAASAVTVYAGYIGTFTAVGQTSGSGCVWNVSWPQTLAVFISGPNPSFYDMGTLSETSPPPCTSASGTVNYMDEALTVSGSTIFGTIGQANQTGGIITITGQVNQTAGTVTGTWQWSEYPDAGGAQGNFILYATSAPPNSTN